MTELKYLVVIHDFHGFWTHHPHRAARAFLHAWLDVVGERPSAELILQILNRPPSLSVRQMAVDLVICRGFPEKAEAIRKAVKHYYDRVYIPNHRLRETVQTLNKLGVRQVLLTNGELRKVVPIVSAWGLAALLEGIVGKGSGIGLKPGVDIVGSILKPLEINVDHRKRCLVVGDYWQDIETAQRNKMDSALLVTGSGQQFPKEAIRRGVIPTYLLLEPFELVAAVLGQNLRTSERLELMLGEGLSTMITKIWQH